MNRIALRWLFLLAASLAAARCPALACDACRTQAAPLPGGFSGNSLYRIGGTWTDDAGRGFSLGELRGHPVVLAMIFTRCSGACPITVAEMRELQGSLPAALRTRVRFVLASFDSAGDTPAVLHAYRGRMGLGDAAWILLHGEPDGVRELAAALGVSYTDEGNGQFVHSSEVTVLNPEGEIVYQTPSLSGGLAAARRAVAAAAP